MVAEHLVKSGDLEMYVPPEHPERPVDIPVDDDALRRILDRVARARARSAQDDRATAEVYRRWAAMLLRAEARSKNKLMFVIACYEDLRAEEQDAYLQSCAARLREHVEYHWPRLKLDNLPPRKLVGERDVYVGRACRRDDLVASWLLYGLKSPRFVPPQSGDGEDEDQD